MDDSGPFPHRLFFSHSGDISAIPQIGKSAFHLSRTAGPYHFSFTHETSAELEEVKHRVALLSRILWWKTLYLRISLGGCLVAIPLFGVTLAISGM
jgi:hypothetical protein